MTVIIIIIIAPVTEAVMRVEGWRSGWKNPLSMQPLLALLPHLLLKRGG